MKRPYYIFSSGRIRRKFNTILFERYEDNAEGLSEETKLLKMEFHTAVCEEEIIELKNTEDISEKDKKFVPVEDIEAFYAFSPLDFNSAFLNFVTQYHIPVHVFNYYGGYAGTYLPRAAVHSGLVTVRQAGFYLRPAERMKIARAFINAASFNILKNLQYYLNRGRPLDECARRIGKLRESIGACETLPQLMGIEGNIRDEYYIAWKTILTNPDPLFRFEKRSKQPPLDPVNALISYGNGFLYSFILTEIYRTALNPAIGYLHEPSDRRFSLSLDVAEIFKPVLIDRIIFKLVNKNMLEPHHFSVGEEQCLLTEPGKKMFIREIDEKLKKTFLHRDMKQEVSFRRLIRLELYKLLRHINREQDYEGFMIWW